MTYQDRFNKPEDAGRFIAAYDAILALWPVPVESLEVETGFGTTHINLAGSPDAPPLVLLHGAQVSSTVWYPNIEPLSRHFRVYTVDVIDQIGRSTPKRNLLTPADNIEWLSGLLDALNIDRASMIGHSNGCWQIAQLAKAYPERVDRMVLLSPGPPFSQVRWQLLLRLLPLLIMPSRRMFYWNFQNMTARKLNAERPDPLVEMFMIGATGFKPQKDSMNTRSLFSDDELRALNVPALVLTGERENLIDPHKVLSRARLMPTSEVDLIPNAGHLLPVDQAEIVNDRMLKFLLSTDFVTFPSP